MKTKGLEVDEDTSQNWLSSGSDSLKVIGYGISITETQDVKELIAQSGVSVEMRHFTDNERSTYKSGARRIEYFAGRWTAKQAVLKALGKEMYEDTAWLDIEIQRLPTGEPSVVLHGKFKQMAVSLGITKWLLSISHESSYAAASAIALGMCNKQSSFLPLKCTST
ncbi:MAG: holo-ACP synthase [Leptolyngbya sp. SIO1D8]|nr:holo-ACP synthase [Leptolyngbya sp. SIO1D8]